jgi:hypothetical protein
MSLQTRVALMHCSFAAVHAYLVPARVVAPKKLRGLCLFAWTLRYPFIT